MVNINLLEKMVEEDLVNATDHPTLPITIFNYSKFCQFKKEWNEITLQCRGLILDDNYNVIAKPFPKFFNLEEEKSIPNEPYTIYEKLDGSLGILFFYEGWHMATRGSFISEQSVKAKQILIQKYSHLLDSLNRDWTYLFEIIYPENRIVLNYGDQEDIIMLGIFDRNSLQEIELKDYGFPYLKPSQYNSLSFKELKNLNIKNHEGFVIKFENGKRIKIKFEDYVQLHGIVTEFSNKKVWEMLSTGANFNDLLEVVPDEFFQKVKDVKEELENQFSSIKQKSISIANDVKNFPDRKSIAVHLLNNHKDVMSVVFGLLDNKDVDKIIWKMIQPDFEKI
jgi:RNA ligase